MATVRASVEDNVTIQLQKSEDLHNRDDSLYFRQMPNDWNSSLINDLTLHLSPAHPSEAGIYIVHNNKGGGMESAYFDVIVRGMPTTLSSPNLSL